MDKKLHPQFSMEFNCHNFNVEVRAWVSNDTQLVYMDVSTYALIQMLV